jgi:UDP-glucose 4-epimerase
MGRPDLAPIFQAERSVNPVPRRLSDASAARELIGFETTIPLEAGLRGLVDWWRDQKAKARVHEAAQ